MRLLLQVLQLNIKKTPLNFIQVAKIYNLRYKIEPWKEFKIFYVFLFYLTIKTLNLNEFLFYMTNIPNWSEKTILVVEDEEVNRFFFETALKITNVTILFAETGWEGLALAEKNENIDCILMDIRLPGIDGYEVTRKIKEKRSDIPIIAQTAYALSNDRAKAFDSGCDEFLSKPIKLGNLFEVLKKYIGS